MKKYLIYNPNNYFIVGLFVFACFFSIFINSYQCIILLIVFFLIKLHNCVNALLICIKNEYCLKKIIVEIALF